MSAAQKRRKTHGMSGKHHSEKTKQHLIEIRNGTPSPNKNKKLEEICGKEKAAEMKLNQSQNQLGKTYKEKFGDEKAVAIIEKKKKATSGKNHFMYGKTFEECFGVEKAGKIRLNARLRLKKQIENNLENGGQMSPWYSHNACLHFNIIMEEMGWFIQHAENYGEFFVLGYWVDGYDKEHNTVYEWDEKHHFNPDGTYTERDMRRQKEITECLGCEFIRIKAWL